MHSCNPLSCLSQPDFSKEFCLHLLLPFLHFPLTSQPPSSIWPSCTTILRKRSSRGCLFSITAADSEYYLKGSYISSNFCRHLLCARQRSERGTWGKEETSPALEKHSVQVGEHTPREYIPVFPLRKQAQRSKVSKITVDWWHLAHKSNRQKSSEKDDQCRWCTWKGQNLNLSITRNSHMGTEKRNRIIPGSPSLLFKSQELLRIPKRP